VFPLSLASSTAITHLRLEFPPSPPNSAYARARRLWDSCAFLRDFSVLFSLQSARNDRRLTVPKPTSVLSFRSLLFRSGSLCEHPTFHFSLKSDPFSLLPTEANSRHDHDNRPHSSQVKLVFLSPPSPFKRGRSLQADAELARRFDVIFSPSLVLPSFPSLFSRSDIWSCTNARSCRGPTPPCFGVDSLPFFVALPLLLPAPSSCRTFVASICRLRVFRLFAPLPIDKMAGNTLAEDRPLLATSSFFCLLLNLSIVLRLAEEIALYEPPFFSLPLAGDTQAFVYPLLIPRLAIPTTLSRRTPVPLPLKYASVPSAWPGTSPLVSFSISFFPYTLGATRAPIDQKLCDPRNPLSLPSGSTTSLSWKNY